MQTDILFAHERVLNVKRTKDPCWLKICQPMISRFFSWSRKTRACKVASSYHIP